LLFLTDAFDGGIARATNNVTVAGARWDPTIDKISEVFLFASFCWALAAVFPHFFWAFFWIVMLRVPFEIGISILAILGEKITIGGKAGAAGKRKFTFDCLSFLFAGAGLISGMSFLLGISCGFIGATYPYAARVLVEEWRNVIPAYRKYLKERKPRT
jgi:phosphatidylglycerophosphate synthase